MLRLSTVLFLVFFVFFPVRPAAAKTEPADSPEVAQMVAQGDLFAAKKQFDKALDAYRKADKLAKHACAACDFRMFEIDRKLGDLSAALDDAKHAEKAAGNDKRLAVTAHVYRGDLLAAMAGKPSDKKLKEAEEELREALMIAPELRIAHFDLGTVLLKQERDEEGVAELKIYAAMPGADPKTVAQALREIANPILAREPMAPDFSFASFDGGTISNEALRGKVVLLDFWATWCPPCRDSVPTLLDIRKKYAERPVEIVGISADNDQQAWQTLIAAHHMDWPDHFDGAGTVAELFDVHAFPTYIVLDRDGFIRFRKSGFGEGETAAELQEAIDKALKRPPMPQVPAAAAAPSSAQN
jgi:thiol-disulfide isomerase/thioredoxin